MGWQVVLGGSVGNSNYRQEEGKGAPLPFFTLDPDVAAVVGDDLFADGQSKARTFGFVLCGFAVYLMEFVEDDLIVLLFNPDPLVGNTHSDP